MAYQKKNVRIHQNTFFLFLTLHTHKYNTVESSLRACVKPVLEHAEELSFYLNKEGAGVDACQGNQYLYESNSNS